MSIASTVSDVGVITAECSFSSKRVPQANPSHTRAPVCSLHIHHEWGSQHLRDDVAWMLVVYRTAALRAKILRNSTPAHRAESSSAQKQESRTKKEHPTHTWICSVTAMTTAERQLLLVEVILAEG